LKENLVSELTRANEVLHLRIQKLQELLMIAEGALGLIADEKFVGPCEPIAKQALIKIKEVRSKR
jgi:hypothetical protein